jgi:N-acetylneuraminate synthase
MNSFGKLKIHKNKPTIIAEVGVNHECNLKKAFNLISDAKNCGVDAVKFQTYKADELAIKNSPAY